MNGIIEIYAILFKISQTLQIDQETTKTKATDVLHGNYLVEKILNIYFSFGGHHLFPQVIKTLDISCPVNE